MVWSIVLCLVSLTTAQLDSVSQLRKNQNPYVFYNFMDSDRNGNGNSTTTAVDVAGHGTINFGNLVLNSQRASWLSGRPGVSLRKETSSVVTAAMASTGMFKTEWMTPYFNNPFVIEMWFQSSDAYESKLTTFFSLARAATWAGSVAASVSLCNATEPLFDFVLNSFSYFRPATESGATCNYALNLRYTQLNTPKVIALYLRYNPVTTKFHWIKYEDGSRAASPTPGITGDEAPLKWVDTMARLAFAQTNDAWGTLDFNLLSFAIYPNISEAQIDELYRAGLPNVKPIAPNFNRAVPETDGGIIRFCRNIPGTRRDSDCLDYTNNNATGTVHALLPSSNLTVTITSLPAKGTLYQDSVAITQVPTTLNSGNQVKFVPRPGETSWWLTVSADVYARQTGDYTSFQYTVRDPDGLTSHPATVTIEVYPKHTAPVSPNITVDMIYAGRAIAPIGRMPTGGSTNVIFLDKYVNREFIPPTATDLTCATAPTNPGFPLCLLSRDTPPKANTTVTIKTEPSKGKLKYGTAGQIASELVERTAGMTVPFDNTVMCPGPALCTLEQSTWLLYFDISLDNYAGNISEILDTTSFTYTTTTRFDLSAVLGSTRYNVDEFDMPRSVGWSLTAESAPGNVSISIRNGFYSRSASSQIKQQNLSSIEPQIVELFAEDLTIPNATLAYKLLSLPLKGALFVNGSLGSDPIRTVPYPLTSNIVYYQPSLPNEPYGFDYGDNYASFVFQTTSDGKTSNNATQTINVVDTNDQVRLSWTPSGSLISYKRVGNPASWSELAGNELKITMIDPDKNVTNEPWYEVTLDAGPNFAIFLENSIWDELQVGKASVTVGQQEGANAAGAGNRRWRFFAPRDLASRALLSIRMRPNANVASTVMTVTIKDCIIQPSTATNPFKSSPGDWTSIPTTASIVLQGSLQEKPDYEGQVDGTVMGVIIGVMSFVGVMLLLAGYFLIKCCCCRKGASASNSVEDGSSRIGSTSSTGDSSRAGTSRAGSTSAITKGGKKAEARSSYILTL